MSLFSTTNTASTANPPPLSMFGNNSTQSTAPAVSTAVSTVPKASDINVKNSSLNSNNRILQDLLQSANNLPKPATSELGTMSLTLNELQKKTQQLRKATGDNNNFTKAHYLLASSGISAEEIENELNSIEVPLVQLQKDDSSLRLAQVSSSVIAQQGNLDNYLSAKKEENILSAIEQSLVSASNDFDQFINRNISIDWKVRRDELRKTFGVSSKSVNTSDAKRAKASELVTWNQSHPGHYNILTPLQTKVLTSSSLRQFSREKFESHAKVIYQLNEARLQNKFFPLCMGLEEINKSNTDLKSKQITDTWRILANLTNEKSAKVSQEQKFFKLYQNSDSQTYTENTQSLHKTIVVNSKAYLEQQFLRYMDEVYTKDDKKAPEFLPVNNINKVSYFINKIIVKNNNNEFVDRTLSVNGTPIWALIFYLLRSGLYNEALDLVNANRDSFNKFDKNFPAFLTKFVEHGGWGLPSDLQVKVNNTFNQQFQYLSEDSADFDPYKYSVYKIIGKCDLSKKSLPQSINLSIEDWLWFHLSIVNEFDNDASSIIFENYSLHNLQQRIVSLGSKRFNSSSNNPLYLKTLILVGLYELAVQYAYEFISECDAAHLAIGLCYYGLLRVSSFNNKDELMIANANDEYEINYSRLLGSYTRTFKISDPKVASQYLILIGLSKGGESKEHISRCHEALIELILVSREFSLLLGELNERTGENIPGILEKQRPLIKLSDVSQFQHQIVETSAVRCEEEGRIFDALLLYQLCQEFDTVVSLINKLLSEILATSELDQPLIGNGNYSDLNGNKKAADTVDNNVILLSEHIMKVFNANSFILDKLSPIHKYTNDLLMPIIKIRETFYHKNWSQTLNEIKDLGIIPIGESQDIIEIRKSVEMLTSNVDDNLTRVIPSLLIMIMTSVSQLNYTINTQRYLKSGSDRDELARLKAIAKNCMVYAGMVQYKMPRETYSLLINLEALL